MLFIMFFADTGKFVAGITAYAKKKSKRLDSLFYNPISMKMDQAARSSSANLTLPHFSLCIAMQTISLTAHTEQPTPPERSPFHAS